MTSPVPAFWSNRYPTDAFTRVDETDDAAFYTVSRPGPHLDSLALSTTSRLIGTLVVEPRPTILDIMAGSDSHLPTSLGAERVVGVGLDKEALQANGRLDEFVLRDLNREPSLPFEDGSFDVVLNTLSVGYLTRPFEVFSEAARVLKPGGLLLVVFSDRSFKTKAVKIWSEASGTERKMLVEEYFASTRAFQPIRSFVSRGRPRPPDDKYAGLGIPSDGIWAVYADRRGAGPEHRARPEVPSLEAEGRVSREELKRRMRKVRHTLRCPHCDQPLSKFEITPSPFCEWPNEFVYVCYNNDCPYLVEGWQVMNEQGNPGFSYRLMYNPDQDRCMPTPIPSVTAARQYVIAPRG